MFYSGLKHTKQNVLVNDVLSSEKSINAGVPHRSVLGPLFILICINDTADGVIGKARLYTDDTSLSYPCLT